jgi:RNA polymerase sigma factor (sigma-70 family)
MSSSSRVKELAERLPFDLSNTDAVNETFERWVLDDDPEAKRTLDLWTYCYIWKYFLTKQARDSITEAADLDDLIARAYQKVEKNRSDVDDTTRYASWVSVVCKNTFLNYARRDRVTESIDDEEGPQLIAETDDDNPGSLRQTILRSIDRLPEYLQETARLYFLERRTFREISEVIGKSVATVRTYKYKAIKRLRDDEELREYLRSS